MKSFRDDLIDMMKTGWGRIVLASKNRPRLSKYTLQPVSRKNQTYVLPVSNFLHRWPHDPVRTQSCLAAQKRFLLFNGPGSFKTIFKIGGNVEYLKACRLVRLTPPPPWSFYSTFKCRHYTRPGAARAPVVQKLPVAAQAPWFSRYFQMKLRPL
jgi:hypothetical protein